MSDPISVADAVTLLDGPAPEAVEPEETVEAVDASTEAEPTADGDLDPDEPAIEFEDDEAENDDPAEPVIAAPKSWAAEDRAIFATLPREAQQVIAAREAERDSSTQKAVQSAAEARKNAEQATESVTQLRAATTQVLTKAAEIFKGKWDNVDWVTWAQTDPAAYTAGKAQFEAEQSELTRIYAVNQAQSQAALQSFHQAKAEQIKTEAPDLVDPVKGPERVQRLEKYLVDHGIHPDIFPTLDAFTIGLANDGLKYRLAKANAGKQTPQTPRAAIRPAAAQSVRTPQRVAAEAQARFQRTGSIDDAVAMMSTRK